MADFHRILLAAALLLAASAMVTGWNQAQAADVLTPDLMAMQGRWLRSDAPYTIELRAHQTGKLKASYFNPRPIHVEKTEIAVDNGRQFVMVELNDKGYDGSTYVLFYNRDLDSLDGIYLHGGSGQQFQVRFSRQNSR